jgi:hypothetical protein
MTLDVYLWRFRHALDDEIKAIRSSGGQKTYVSDGHYLGVRDGWYIYSFTADTELHFPDDTPIDLECRGQKHQGLILSIEGFDLIIAVQRHVGDSVATAILYTSPWFLLVELQRRLEKLRSQSGHNSVLPNRLLEDVSRVSPAEISTARALLEQLEAQLGDSIACNDHQLQAVGMVLANDVTFIWGPPGTGKTRTLGITAAALAEHGESVLIVTHSNVAVDVAMANVARILQGSPAYRSGRVLRYGVSYLPELDNFPQLHVKGAVLQQSPLLVSQIEALEKQRRQLVRQSRAENLSHTFRQQLKDEIAEAKRALEPLHAELKRKEAELIGNALVVGCTLSKATISPEVYERRFDAVLIDEASTAYIPHCAFASSLAERHAAVYGDFRQLAPISQADTASARRWLQRDIFDQAGIMQKVNAGQTDNRLVLLATQYRMHPAISAVPNSLFYGQRLKDGPNVAQNAALTIQKPPAPGRSLVFKDLTSLSAQCFSEPESHSRFNPISALATVELAYAATQAGQDDVGIVTPYNAQSRLIHRLLKDMELSGENVHVATVHRFQGSERDVILFDVAEGEPKKPGLLVQGGMGSTAMRLANVAISRARGKFIVLANFDYIRSRLDPLDSFRQLLDDIASRTTVETTTWPRQTAHSLWGMDLPGLTIFPNSRTVVQDIESDLTQAKEEIAIGWPTALADFHFSAHVLKRCDPSRVRFFVSGSGSSSFYIGLKNAQIWGSRSRTSMGLVGIDRKLLWVYVDPLSSSGPVLRLDFPLTAKLLYAYWRLIPDEEVRQETLEEKLDKGKSPVGMPCRQCGGALWPATGRYGVYLTCTSECGYTKRITPTDATSLARLMGIVCGFCGGQVKGRKGYRGVFLGCASYPDCRWTMALADVV